jgi:hypothetical protein
VTVHVTGFKKFIGVPENPTEKIVRNIQSYMEKKGFCQKTLYSEAAQFSRLQGRCTWHTL